MSVEKCLTVAEDFARRVVGQVWKIIGVVPRQDGWIVRVEVVEEDEYMRRHGRDELLAEYEIEVSPGFEIVSFSRTGFRHRGEIPEPGSENEE